MKTFADSITNKKTLKQITTAFTGYPKPTPVQIIHHATIDLRVNPPTATLEYEVLSAVHTQMEAISSALEIVRKRQEILQQSINHAESLGPVVVPAVEETRSSKSKRKSTGPTEDKQCAWDPRLIWSDDETKMADIGGLQVENQVDVGVCESGKRRCDKHSGWQKTIALSLELEEQQLVSRGPKVDSVFECMS